MNWIKCGEKLPQIGERVLVYSSVTGVTDIAHLVECTINHTYHTLAWKRDWNPDVFYLEQNYFTHWIPLPKPQEDT